MSYAGCLSVPLHRSITDAPEEWAGQAAPKRSPPQTGCGFTSSAMKESNAFVKKRSRMVGLFRKGSLLLKHLF